VTEPLDRPGGSASTVGTAAGRGPDHRAEHADPVPTGSGTRLRIHRERTGDHRIGALAAGWRSPLPGPDAADQAGTR
jgi:hypothetical protein